LKGLKGLALGINVEEEEQNSNSNEAADKGILGKFSH